MLRASDGEQTKNVHEFCVHVVEKLKANERVMMMKVQ